MKSSICYSLLLSAYCLLCFAQAPDTLWTKTYGYASHDAGYDVKETADGGYIIVGYTVDPPNGEEYVFLLKTDENGDTTWTEMYGWFDTWSRGYEVQQTFDGGYVIAAESFILNPAGIAKEVWIIKTGLSGTIQWQQYYGFMYDQGAFSIQQTADSGYIVAGYFGSDFNFDSVDVWLLKTDVNGDTVWTQTYGGAATDVAYSVKQTADEGYILAGYTFSFGVGVPDSSNIYLVKTDSLGDTLWTKTYGGTAHDIAYAVLQTNDSGYVVLGTTRSFGAGNYDVFLMRINANGDTLWTQTYGTNAREIGRDINFTHDGGYIIVGYDGNVLIIKTDSLGNEEWTTRVGGSGPQYGRSVQQTADSGYIIAGYTEVFGTGFSDVYLIRLESETGVEEQVIHHSDKHFGGTTIINGPILLPEDKTCRVFDITGRQVIPYDVKPGIYFIEVDGKVIQKIIKIQ